MVLPNFLLIGAAKCGTTSLAHYLDQHPEIFMSPEKEPRFFAEEFHTKFANGPVRKGSIRPIMTLSEYELLFQDVTTEKAIGEASTEYIFFEETPKRIKALIPDVKLIAVLRNPIERAFSAYCYQRRDSVETLSFEQALEDEDRRRKEYWRPGWLYKTAGYYYQQVSRYYEFFEPDQFRIYLFEELNQYPMEMLKDIFMFLEVNSSFQGDLSRKNISEIPKNADLNYLLSNQSPFYPLREYIPEPVKKLLREVKNKNRVPKPKLSEDLKKKLLTEYKDDILKLQDLICKDLSNWLLF